MDLIISQGKKRWKPIRFSLITDLDRKSILVSCKSKYISVRNESGWLEAL